ncbi:hypothetical protein ACSBR1_022647 [Camellia fascicularis]
MASSTQAQTYLNQTKHETPNVVDDVERQQQPHNMEPLELEVAVAYWKQAQWGRAAVLGAIDGLLSTVSLMMGVRAVRKDVKTMILTGIAGTIGGACSMAIGEFVSVYSQYNIEMSQTKRGGWEREISESEIEEKKKHLPSPLAAATALASSSASASVVGAVVSLLAAAFINDYWVRVGVRTKCVSILMKRFFIKLFHNR